MKVQYTRELVDQAAGGYARVARLVSRGELTRVRPGVVTAETDPPSDQLLRASIEAAAPFLNAGTLFSHRSAALVHGLPVMLGRRPVAEVVRTLGGHGNRSRHLHARAASLSEHEATVVDGLPVTSIIRTVVDLVRTVTFPEAVMIVDRALQLGLTKDELRGAVGEGKGRRKAERAIEFGNPASESPPESESRARIAAAGLEVPEIQVDLCDASGAFVARPDFFWRWRRAVGEYDGEGKYRGEYGLSPAEAIRREKQRHAALEANGFHVIRWDKSDLRLPGQFETRVRKFLAQWPPLRAEQQ